MSSRACDSFLTVRRWRVTKCMYYYYYYYYITALSKSCFYHIRALRHIRPILSEDTANLIASSLVSSRLDYANACLFGISVKNLSRIQRIQNTLARVVTCSRSRSSSAPLLKHLHWLPVSARIHFKIALLTFKSLHAI